MSATYTVVKVDAVTWRIADEDYGWASGQVAEALGGYEHQNDISDEEYNRRVVALCHGWGRRITEALPA